MAILMAHWHITLVALSAPVPKQTLLTDIQSGFKPTQSLFLISQRNTSSSAPILATSSELGSPVKNPNQLGHSIILLKTTGPSSLPLIWKAIIKHVSTELSQSFCKWGTFNVPQHINTIIHCALYAT